MNPKKHLHNSINLIFLVLWMIIFVTQSIYISVLYKNTLADAQKVFTDRMNSLHSELELKVNTATQLSKAVMNDPKITEYFLCENSRSEEEQLWADITSPLKDIHSMTSERFYAISFRHDMNLKKASDGTCPELIRAAREAYTSYSAQKTELVFYSMSDAPYNDMLLFIFCDIQLPDSDSVDMNHFGTMIIAGTFNKYQLMRTAGLDENTRITLHYAENDEPDIVLLPGTEHKHQFSTKMDVAYSKWSMYGSAVVDTHLSSGLLLIMAETIFMSVLLFIVQRYTSKNIVSPLYKISDFLKHYSLLQKGNRLNIKNSTEIGGVADKINEMIAEIEQLSHEIVYTQQQLYESELAQKDAALYALQAQLNPHFMYNTLDCMCGIANVSGVPLIADVAVALAKMLRYNLAGERTVPLCCEVEIAKNYLTIIEVRRPDYFTAEFSIPPEVEKLSCLKMLLQPIIENSFKHGFDSRIKKAHILVSANTDEKNLIITILDNGKGMSEKRLDAVTKSLEQSSAISPKGSHIGLTNIQHRIRLNYGKDYGLYIESKEGKYTKTVIRLPKIKEKYQQQPPINDI